jgi:hypothetical protein
MLTLKLIALLLASIDVQVDLLEGEPVTGSLTAITSDEMTLTIDGQPKSTPLSNVITVTNRQSSRPSEDDQGQLILDDGSTIAGRLQSINAKEVISSATFEDQLTIPRPAVRAIRLSPENPEWAEEWSAFLERENDDDLLILKKRDGSGLDFYGGVISATADDKIEFILDGDSVPVPLTRIYGLLFAVQQSQTGGTIAVRLSDKSTVMATNLQVQDNTLRIETNWNQTIPVPLNTLQSIDFSSGRFHYLSDLDPVKETYRGIHPEGSPLEDLLKADDILGEEIRSLWKLRRDQLPMGPLGPLPLKLRGKVYQKGVWLFPSCRIDYALDGRYSRFQSIAGVDDEVAFNCSRGDIPSKVKLTLLTDGDEAWSEIIEAPADPLKISLDVTGVRTLSIDVDFGDGDSACDFLDLADARLLVIP